MTPDEQKRLDTLMSTDSPMSGEVVDLLNKSFHELNASMASAPVGLPAPAATGGRSRQKRRTRKAKLGK